VPHTIDSRIDGRRREFANAEFIDPRLTFRHSYVTFVPENATFLLVQCSLDFPMPWRRRAAKKNTQKLLRVPGSGVLPSGHEESTCPPRNSAVCSSD
jgi:hypothetical protein